LAMPPPQVVEYSVVGERRNLGIRAKATVYKTVAPNPRVGARISVDG